MDITELRGEALFRQLAAWAAAELEAASRPTAYTKDNQLGCAKRIRECLEKGKWEKHD